MTHHDSWHELLELIAAAALVGGGGLVVALSFIARRRAEAPAPLEPPAPVGSVVAILVGVLSLAAAAVHLAAAPAHIDELGGLGWGFVGVALFQASWALAWGIDRARGLALMGIAGNLAVIAAWLWTRTAGLPVGLLAGTPEPIGTPDAAATIFESALVGFLAARLLEVERWIGPRLRDARSLATIAVVPAIGIVLLATTLAVSLALGHGHAPGESTTADHAPAAEHR